MGRRFCIVGAILCKQFLCANVFNHLLISLRIQRVLVTKLYLGAYHLTSGGGGGGGWVIWSGYEFFFNTLIHNEVFFLRVCVCMLFFSPSNILQELFLCWWGWKSRLPLLLLATLAAVLFNSNRGLILAFMQLNSTAEQMRSVTNVPNNPFVMHPYLTLSCLLHQHMYRGP